MKKFLLLAVSMFVVALSAKAQIVDTTIVNSGARDISIDDINYVHLIQTQNKLLKNRSVALAITVSGIGTSVLGSMIYANSTSPASAIIFTAGMLVGATGSVWLVVNEFKAIKNQRAINDMRIEAIPGGLALKF